MRTFQRFLLSVVLAAAGAVPALAQTTVDSTTLAAAVNASTNVITVTSATNVSVGQILFIDREAMKVNALTGTRATVTRGVNGTAARPHSALATLYVGSPVEFYSDEVTGGATCTATAELYTPRIVLPSGNVYVCQNSIWKSIGDETGSIQASFVQGGTAADAIDSVFFLADRDYVVTAITAVWGVAETTGAMAIQVEKLTSTTACASGTDLLASTIDATGTADTVATGSLSTTASAHLLAAGNRLCVDLTSTPNEVANMVVTVTLVPR